MDAMFALEALIRERVHINAHTEPHCPVLHRRSNGKAAASGASQRLVLLASKVGCGVCGGLLSHQWHICHCHWQPVGASSSTLDNQQSSIAGMVASVYIQWLLSVYLSLLTAASRCFVCLRVLLARGRLSF